MPQSNAKLEVVLPAELREQLEALVRKSGAPARQVRNARILLMADEDRREGRRPDWYIAECVGVSERQVVRIRQKYVREGLTIALERKPRSAPGTTPKFDGEAEAKLAALCCSTPPAGRQRWTLQLLCDEAARLQIVASVCPETVRRCLKKTGCNLGGRNATASPTGTARGSSRTSRKSSTPTAKATTKRARSSAWTKPPSR